MELNREALVAHLRAIYTDTAVAEVVLKKNGAAAATTPDQSLAVVAPAYEGPDGEVLKFSADIGIVDLGLFINALGLFSDADMVEVDYGELEDQYRLTVSEEGDREIRMVTAQPKRIGTKVSAAALKTIMAAVPEDMVELDAVAARSIIKAQGMLSALEVRLMVTTEGVTARVGPPTGQYADINIPGLEGDDTYELILQGNTVVRVLNQINEFGEDVKIGLTGEDSSVFVKNGDYVYVLSPMEAT